MDDREIKLQLESALEECRRLKEENAALRRLLAEKKIATPAGEPKSVQLTLRATSDHAAVDDTSGKDAKVALFRSLFRGREDVYAVRKRFKNGEWGYVPESIKNWEAVLSADAALRKKVDRETRKLVPLTDEVVRKHLEGKLTIGVYPLLLDETCWFLAVDFDKKTWREDVGAYLATCRELGVPATLERSRSGNGAHVWIFFDSPIPAATARKLGCLILTRTMDRRHQLGMESYDRFFPNQDTMPKGGFGNLIALPLQWIPRQDGNSVFLDEDFQPYPDQWRFLAGFRGWLPNL